MEALCNIYRIKVNSDELRYKEISRIGYDFLPIAAGDYAGSPLEDLSTARKEYGKPYFPHHPEIAFNISNSGDWILIAVSSVEVGIDIQEITPIRLDRIGKRIFTPGEYELFAGVPDQREYFFREWVLRESYIKWTGEGLSRDMRDLPHDAWQTLLPAPDGYTAALTAAIPLLCRDTEVHYDRQKGFIWTK